MSVCLIDASITAMKLELLSGCFAWKYNCCDSVYITSMTYNAAGWDSMFILWLSVGWDSMFILLLTVLDAEGKIPSGVMEGHVAWYGDYTECQSIKSNPANTTIPQIHGRHCLLFMSTKSPAPITVSLYSLFSNTYLPSVFSRWVVMISLPCSHLVYVQRT